MFDVQDIYRLNILLQVFIKIHQEMRKLLEFLAFVNVNMGAAILDI